MLDTQVPLLKCHCESVNTGLRSSQPEYSSKNAGLEKICKRPLCGLLIKLKKGLEKMNNRDKQILCQYCHVYDEVKTMICVYDYTDNAF